MRKLAAAAALTAAFTTGSAQAQLLFHPVNTYPVGDTPLGVAVGDLDGDGIPDVVSANFQSGNVSVLLGNGDGTLGAPSPFTTGAETGSVAIGGFTGPGGRPDLLAGTASGVIRLANQGAGSFGAPHTYSTGFMPYAVLTPFLQDFPLRSLVAAGGGAVGSIEVWDATCDQTSCDGTLNPVGSWNAGSFPVSVASDDFNCDFFGDLAIADNGGSNVRVLVNSADESDQFSAPPLDLAVGTSPTGVTTGDFNGDGKPDIASANAGDGTVSVLLNTTDCNTVSFAQAKTFGTGPGPQAIAAADLNLDGKQDLVTANSDGTVSILLGNGNGTFQAARTIAVGGSLSDVQVADLDGDGAPDLILANATEGVQVLRAAPILHLSASAIDFGAGDVSSPGNAHKITITNLGTGALRISRAMIAGSEQADFQLVSDTCGGDVKLNKSCTLGVQFTAGDVGRRTGELDITANGEGPQPVITLTGIGASPAGPTIESFTLSHGKFRFRYSESARTTIMITRRGCQPTRRNHRCLVKTIASHSATLGGSLKLPRLNSGRYRATVRATGLTGHRSHPKSILFRVARRHHRH